MEEVKMIKSLYTEITTQIQIEISPVLRDLITVISCY